ncbi:MAG: DNA replication/repair protein RecF [Xanthomonadales bacterium]|jgi:DNA replication and repair protein RecF|nr:DNA replication/repair protein RecF [Xanthomonadales bacterium]
MHVRSLSITNLRNVSDARVEPAAGFNLLVGDNGAGKTTVLESLVILGKGRSFRSGAIGSLIGSADPAFRVLADIVDDHGKPHRVGLERTRDSWRGRLDGEEMHQISESAPLFPLVLMEPTSYLLVSGSPDVRRRFLDWTVFHVKPEFLGVWRRYARVLKQRNAALRQGSLALIQSLDPQFIALGEQLHALRDEVFGQLAPRIEALVSDMSPDLGQPAVCLKSGWGLDSLAESLAEGLNRDREQGMTRQGPHRADVQFRIDGRSVRDRLSRGEQKILAAASLLSQATVFSDTGHRPVVLLDDLASEFDQAHLDQVMSHVQALGAQHFVTGVDCAPFNAWKGEKVGVFHVKQGVIERHEARS